MFTDIERFWRLLKSHFRRIYPVNQRNMTNLEKHIDEYLTNDKYVLEQSNTQPPGLTTPVSRRQKWAMITLAYWKWSVANPESAVFPSEANILKSTLPDVDTRVFDQVFRLPQRAPKGERWRMVDVALLQRIAHKLNVYRRNPSKAGLWDDDDAKKFNV